jgi:hypothetical protein
MRFLPLAGVVGLLTSTAAAECTCKKALVNGGWCSDCKEGYVAGVMMKSPKLYEAVSVSPNEGEKLDCDACKKFAAAGTGYCTKCKVGFVGKNHSHSMVGYTLARGDATDPATIKCAACKKAAGSTGWCDSCKAGMVGYACYKDKPVYDAAAKARETLVAAASSKCEGCAVAMVSDGTCQTCKIAYKDGKKADPKDAKDTGAKEPGKP